MATFSEADITVTLTGKQWFALLARIVKSTPHDGLFSKEGSHVYHRATRELQRQLLAAGATVKATEWQNGV